MGEPLDKTSQSGMAYPATKDHSKEYQYCDYLQVLNNVIDFVYYLSILTFSHSVILKNFLVFFNIDKLILITAENFHSYLRGFIHSPYYSIVSYNFIEHLTFSWLYS